jgi:multicomponent Na+:H+ antiporter subunit B
MSPPIRLALFILATLICLPAIAAIALHMPAFGAHALPYGDLIDAVAPGERHVSNMVSAINFDYRGFDTLGEEFMLLGAVTGTVVLLRGERGEDLAARPGIIAGRPLLPHSDAVVLICRLTAPLLMVFALYVALHAMTTPGGGFQGGAIAASALVLLFLGEGYPGWRGVMRSPVIVAFEGGGSALYGLCGFAGIALGLPYLTNFLPLGTYKGVWSGGLMLVENAGVTCAVGGGFCLIFLEFLEETRMKKGPDERETRPEDINPDPYVDIHGQLTQPVRQAGSPHA